MNRGTFQWLLDHSIPFNRFLIIQLNERLGQFIGMMAHECLLRIDYGSITMLDLPGLRCFGE